MSEKSRPDKPSAAVFFAETSHLATEFGWETATLNRESEMICVAAIPSNPAFERLVWVYDYDRTTLRSMLIGKQLVPDLRRHAIFELCARVNNGLPFGCFEYAFEDDVLVIRDSADLDWGPIDKVIKGSTSRVLNLGKRYASAIEAVLDGTEPKVAVLASEAV